MSIYQKFGLREIINASGKMTALGASAVHSDIADALKDAAQDYVDIDELMVKSGKYIAEATGAEDGCPTSGAAAGIAISVAAVIAGTNLHVIERLPNSDGKANEIVLQKGHSVHFGAPIVQMVALGGGKVVEVGQANHVEKQHIQEAVNEHTAALLYIKSHHAVQKGMQSIETMIAIAEEKNLPIIVDAAAEEDLKKYLRLGANLVIYSGGKALGGPTSGFICGRRDLIQACRAQYKGIGRPMKVGKEAIIGLLTALEHYGTDAENVKHQLQKMEWVIGEINKIPGLHGTIVQDEAGREIYRAQIAVNKQIAGMDAYEVIKKLEAGNPAIFTRNHYANLGLINIDPRPLLPDQEKIIVQRFKEILIKCF